MILLCLYRIQHEIGQHHLFLILWILWCSNNVFIEIFWILAVSLTLILNNRKCCKLSKAELKIRGK